MAEWSATPEERRVAEDAKAYSMSQFQKRYGSRSWVAKWNAARIATQEHTAKDWHNYTIKEFFEYYKTSWPNSWPEQWKATTEIPCMECCGGLNHALCDLRPSSCKWKFTGDWKTSCIPRFASEASTPS